MLSVQLTVLDTKNGHLKDWQRTCAVTPDPSLPPILHLKQIQCSPCDNQQIQDPLKLSPQAQEDEFSPRQGAHARLHLLLRRPNNLRSWYQRKGRAPGSWQQRLKGWTLAKNAKRPQAKLEMAQKDHRDDCCQKKGNFW